MDNSSGGSSKNRVETLDTSKAERAVWLMKCPPLVSTSLQCPPSDSRPVPKVVLSIDPLRSNDDDSSPEFTMELAPTEPGSKPKCFTMDMSKDFVPMSVFSQTGPGNLAVEGKIKNKFDMKPANESLEDYGKLCRERTNKSMTKTRRIQVIGDDNGTRMRPMPGMITTSRVLEKKKVPTKASDTKRTRRDRGEMEEIMFKLFERQPNWTLKQLIQETDQPEQFMKDLLKELCVYNNKGSNQGTYELKPEYKKSSDEPV